jgi:hypothetical protein
VPHAAARLITIRGALAVALSLVVLMAAAAPATAISGSSSDGNVAAAQYPPKPANIEERPAADGGEGDGEGIPFSGFATMMLAGMGLLTLSGGLALMRAARAAD